MNIRSRDQLIDFVDNGNTVNYVFFWDHQEIDNQISKSCLSQWYDTKFEEDGYHFITAEHYMMYHKAKLFKDHKACEKILTSDHPGKAKELGRQVVGFNHDIWIKKRFEIVVNGNLAKFSQNNDLKRFLLNTKDRILVEASPVDKIWGVGQAQDSSTIQDPRSWAGLNLMGFALMEVRDQLSFNPS
ncbi:NADAR family protein [Microbulbifer sp. TRSA005]|uniref:NADAR family protein n=1 Tax=Microbulbifer sp. TRSA005 TaxID=3243383 RepID=UPI004039F36E